MGCAMPICSSCAPPVCEACVSPVPSCTNRPTPACTNYATPSTCCGAPCTSSCGAPCSSICTTEEVPMTACGRSVNDPSAASPVPVECGTSSEPVVDPPEADSTEGVEPHMGGCGISCGTSGGSS